MSLVLDLESLPSLAPGAREAAKARVKVPGNYSKPESIAKYIEENAEEEYRRTALDGGYGELLCVSFAYDDGSPITYSRFGFDTLAPDADTNIVDIGEKVLLKEVLYQLSTLPQFGVVIGHNITWDLKFLYQRAVIHGLVPEYIRVLPISPSPWAGQVFDTSYAWTWDKNRGIKLGELCNILGVPSPKDGLDGSQVFDAFQEGGLHEIIKYAEQDVVATRAVYKRLTGVSG